MRPNYRLRLHAAFLMTALIVGVLLFGIHVKAQDSTPEANATADAPSNRIAYLEGNEYRSSLFIYDLDTDVRQDLLESSYYIGDFASIAGGGMAFIWSSELYLWDGTTAVDITPQDTLQIFSLVSSADGRLAFVLKEQDAIDSNEFKLYVWENGEYRRLGLVSRSASITWSADGRLAFGSARDGNDEIYVWSEGELTNVSSSPSADARPTWSADGRLAYVSSRDGHRTLFVWDGSTLTDLGQADGHYLTWSADGRLAFTSFRDGNREIYIWENGVSTNISQSAGEEWQPTWSADGRLAFTTYHDNLRELFLWDGSTLTTIGQWDDMSELAWNINGHLAFSAGGEIFVWDGSTATNITNTPDQSEFNPYWLP